MVVCWAWSLNSNSKWPNGGGKILRKHFQTTLFSITVITIYISVTVSAENTVIKTNTHVPLHINIPVLIVKFNMVTGNGKVGWHFMLLWKFVTFLCISIYIYIYAYICISNQSHTNYPQLISMCLLTWGNGVQHLYLNYVLKKALMAQLANCIMYEERQKGKASWESQVTFPTDWPVKNV